jgi:hypothetical protein
MTLSNFHGKPKVPDTMANLDHSVVIEVLARHSCNVTDAAADLGIPASDLRRLMWANPKMQDAAFEQVEARLDRAEKNIVEALNSEDGRRRDAASFFVLRNSARARRRGWITTSTSAAELSVTANAPARTLTFRWRTSEDDERDAEAAEAERLRDEGRLIEHEASPELSNEDENLAATPRISVVRQRVW